MFTGIVEEVGAVTASGGGRLTVAASTVTDDLKVGGSISVNGACLTVTSLDETSFSVDVVPETLRRTNLGGLRAGDRVNLERPVPVGGRLDGHVVQGHVDGTGGRRVRRARRARPAGAVRGAGGGDALRRAQGVRGCGRYESHGCRL